MMFLAGYGNDGFGASVEADQQVRQQGLGPAGPGPATLTDTYPYPGPYPNKVVRGGRRVPGVGVGFPLSRPGPGVMRYKHAQRRTPYAPLRPLPQYADAAIPQLSSRVELGLPAAAHAPVSLDPTLPYEELPRPLFTPASHFSPLYSAPAHMRAQSAQRGVGAVEDVLQVGPYEVSRVLGTQEAATAQWARGAPQTLQADLPYLLPSMQAQNMNLPGGVPLWGGPLQPRWAIGDDEVNEITVDSSGMTPGVEVAVATPAGNGPVEIPVEIPVPIPVPIEKPRWWPQAVPHPKTPTGWLVVGGLVALVIRNWMR